ncbi:MAG TPA: DUF6049 family protein [Acidimicrobiales bacterium]|nr:DUF6049 family protein [Acidimicrobiales bacterium]
MPAGRARFSAVLVLTLLVGAGAAGAQPAPPTGRGRMTFVAQTPWVATGGDFLIRVHVDRPPGASNLEFVLTVFPAVATRSEFVETLADRMADSPHVTLQPVPLAGLRTEANGDVVLSVPIRDPNQPRDPSRVLLPPRDGVYPVRVELRDRLAGTTVDKFVTHLLHTPEVHVTPKLGVSLVFPVHAPPALQPDGTRVLPDGDVLTAMAQGVEAVRATPFVLAPTPETVAALAASNEREAKVLLNSLRSAAAERTMLSGPYVPANLAALMGAGLDGEVASQLNRGAATLTEILGARLDSRTWLAEEALDPKVIDTLAGRGFDRVLTAEPLLTPIPEQKLTLTRPFVLSGRSTRVQAAAADAGLTAHFDGAANQALSAHHLLADLAVVYLDRPGDDERRGVAAVAPRDWRPTRQFTDVVTGGLALSPIIEPMSLDTLFASVPGARDDSGANLVRRPAIPTPGSVAEVAADVAEGRRNLNSLGSVLGSGNAASAVIEEQLLVAESSDLKTLRQREAYVTGANRQVKAQLDEIEMPEGRSFTLTARTGEIPLTFKNNTGKPVRVVVRIESDKLDFPAGTTVELELTRLNTIQRFPVVARASGAFPIRITMESPDGHLEVGRARITVRSTAASGASLVVAMGAATFLAVWWGRNAMKGRRARGLVPEE